MPVGPNVTVVCVIVYFAQTLMMRLMVKIMRTMVMIPMTSTKSRTSVDMTSKTTASRIRKRTGIRSKEDEAQPQINQKHGTCSLYRICHEIKFY